MVSLTDSRNTSQSLNHLLYRPDPIPGGGCISGSKINKKSYHLTFYKRSVDHFLNLWLIREKKGEKDKLGDWD